MIVDLLPLFVNGERRIVCPKCAGGATGEKSFSIWADTDSAVLKGHCYRAGCAFYTTQGVTADTANVYLDACQPFVPHPLRRAYRTKEFGLYGERVLVDDPTVTVWILRDLQGNRTGHITRTAAKRVLTYKEVDRSVYYWNGLALHKTLWLFEDPKSAAMCSVPAVALLGTSLPASLLQDIADTPRGRQLEVTVFVALDPGAEDAAAKVHERLRERGMGAVFVPMPKDFKDMTSEERDMLLETYS